MTLHRKLAALATARATVAQREAEVAAECRAYSMANGFGCYLTPEQVLRDVEARARRVA